jgi:hypothetical protein
MSRGRFLINPFFIIIALNIIFSTIVISLHCKMGQVITKCVWEDPPGARTQSPLFSKK